MRNLLINSVSSLGLALALFSCGGDDASGSGAVVSCDIVSAGLHYCEEFQGATSGQTGCPSGMAGFTPGTGCSRAGVAGTCKTGAYSVYFYGTGTVESAVSSICPGGSFEPGNVGAGGGAGAGSGGGSANWGTGPDSVQPRATDCSVSVSGELTGKQRCIAEVKKGSATNPAFIDIASYDGLFHFRLFGDSATGVGKYSTALATDDMDVSGTVWASRNGKAWSIAQNQPLGSEMGEFEMEIVKLSGATTDNQTIHGTFDATYDAYGDSGATGQVKVHVEAP